jgi:hypothetical protein
MWPRFIRIARPSSSDARPRDPQQTKTACRREVVYPYSRSPFSRFAKSTAHATGHPAHLCSQPSPSPPGLSPDTDIPDVPVEERRA